MDKNKLKTLLQEHDELFDHYVEIGRSKEAKQNNYLQNISISNNVTGEIFNISASLQKKLLQQHSALEQKIGFIHYLAKEQNLTEVFFLTITAPSQYHPFKRTKENELILNPNFQYKTIKAAIQPSYKAVEGISRKFYRSLKQRLRGSGIADQLLFVKVNEYHNSFIVHQHLMIMLPADITVKLNKRNGREVSLAQWAKRKFYEILKQEDFNYTLHPKRKTNDFKKIKDDGRSISQYMMKYIQKTTSAAKKDEFGNDSSAYFLYGWKTANKIRHATTSQLPLNMQEYQKLYYQLEDRQKEQLIQQADFLKTNLMIELSKITAIVRERYERENDLNNEAQGQKYKLVKVKNAISHKNPIFKINTKILKTNFIANEEQIQTRYSTMDMQICKDEQILYQKSNFTAHISQNNYTHLKEEESAYEI
ncbi:hypothetical protein [Sulfurimonas sp.]|uniref:hypothetical protein n=1 Tax=Sulfurimonas sp. TaxID=2022749 RepID=UPI003D0E4AEB